MYKRIVVAVLGIVSVLVGLFFYYVASMAEGVSGINALGLAIFGILFTIGGLIILVLALVKRILLQVILIALVLVPQVLWIYGPVYTISTGKEIYGIGEAVEINYSIFYINVMPIHVYAPEGFTIFYEARPNSTEDSLQKYMAVWSEGSSSEYYLGLFFYANTHVEFVWNQTCWTGSEARYQALPGHYYVWVFGRQSHSFIIQ